MPRGIYKRTIRHYLINLEHLKKATIIAASLPRTEKQLEAAAKNAKRMGSLPKTTKQIQASKINGKKLGQMYFYKKGSGKAPLKRVIFNLSETKQWRIQVFERDNYTCRECGKRGYLEAHHIKPFAIIFLEFLKKYSQFSPFEDKETLIRLALCYEEFWDINNGKTLCKECHDKTKKGVATLK